MLFGYTRFLNAHTVQTVTKHVRMWHCLRTYTNGDETSSKNTHTTDLDQSHFNDKPKVQENYQG